MSKRILILLFTLICISTYSQNKYTPTYQTWTRIQGEYKNKNIIISQHFEHRYDYVTSNQLNQARTEVIDCSDNKIHLGAGLTIRVDEYIIREIVKYDIHQFIIEERFFDNYTLIRLRYLLYPEFKLKGGNKINIGIEQMIQGPLDKKLTPCETRLMLDFSQKSGNTTLRVGYMASIFQTHIIHSLKITAILHYEEK